MYRAGCSKVLKENDTLKTTYVRSIVRQVVGSADFWPCFLILQYMYVCMYVHM